MRAVVELGGPLVLVGRDLLRLLDGATVLEVGVQVSLGVVVGGDLVALSAFLVPACPLDGNESGELEDGGLASWFAGWVFVGGMALEDSRSREGSRGLRALKAEKRKTSLLERG